MKYTRTSKRSVDPRSVAKIPERSYLEPSRLAGIRHHCFIDPQTDQTIDEIIAAVE